jgi:hypothetical protein
MGMIMLPRFRIVASFPVSLSLEETVKDISNIKIKTSPIFDMPFNIASGI